MKEETCIILDFLPAGYADRRKPEPIAQAIGTSFFSMLELIARENTALMPEEEAYIGDGKRDKIRFIRGQLEFRDLTNMARTVLPDVVDNLVARNENRFVDFFNRASTITPRMHQFELLPGVGKKHLMDILEERRKKPFESFEDLKQRVKQFTDPAKSVALRIMKELEGEEKYYIFTQGPPRRF